jgi:threonine aldolase
MGIALKDIIERGAALPNPYILNGNRVVIHHQTDPQALQDLLSVIHQLQGERKV